MANFWEEVVSNNLDNRAISTAWEALSHVASFRPTVYIGLGGFGCGVIRKLKKEIANLISDENIRNGFAFLGFDTQSRDMTDILTSNEYFGETSIGIVPNTIAKDPDHGMEWFLELAKRWEAKTIQAGANKIRAVGRLAALYPPTLEQFFAGLTSALNNVNTFRTNFGVTASPKVYVISSTAGGTGSGILLDIMIIAGQYLMGQYGANFQFHSILATPEALEGEAKNMDFPDFYANTYATLKEIYHFILGNDELVSYKISGQSFNPLRASSIQIPHTIYFITDRNTSGKTVAETFSDLQEFAVGYLLSEIQTPLESASGQPKPQDGENVFFDNDGHGNMPKALSSFGVVRFGLPYDQIENLLTLSLMHKGINDDLCDYIGNDGTVDNLITSYGLAESGSNQLQESIAKDKEGKGIRITIDTQGKLDGVKRTDMEKACKELKSKSFQAINEQYQTILKVNSGSIQKNAELKIKNELDNIMQNRTLAYGLSFLESIIGKLKTHQEALSQELNDSKIKLQKADEKVNQSIGNVINAAKSGIFRRKERINVSISAFDGDLEAYLNQQITVWSQAEGIDIYKNLIKYCQDLYEPWIKVRDVLKGRLSFVEKISKDITIEIDKIADINKRGPGNRFSLVNSQKTWDIYKKYIDKEAEQAISSRARAKWREIGIISDITSTDQEWVNKAKESIQGEVKNRISQLNLLTIIDMFYNEDKDKHLLFTSIMALGSPLFPLDPNKREPQYSESYVVAVNPSIRDDFLNLFAKYCPTGASIGNAYFSTAYEVVIYSMVRGYTAHSLTRINTYKSHYDQLQESYKRAVAEKRAHRPIHSWLGADDWEELVPRPSEKKEAYKWFILGRAFSYLFPTATKSDGKPDEKKNEAFIYNRGNNYNIILADGEKGTTIGNSIATAIMNFENHPEWQKRIKTLVEAKISELGNVEIRNRITNEYIPIVDNEIRRSEGASREYERAEILREMLKELNKYIKEELIERSV